VALSVGAVPSARPVAGRLAPRARAARLGRALTLSNSMYDMAAASVSVRELQQHLRRVLARVERGEVVEVTRRRRPVARLAPIRPARPVSDWPDLEARTRAVFGDRLVEPGGSSLVIEGRVDR
jgi:prevent-host-death family protein